MSRWFATVILLCWVSAVLLQPLLQTTPNQIRLDAILASPSMEYWLGNDALGRSVGERLLAGAEIALLVSVATVLISALAGTLIGALIIAVIQNGMNLTGVESYTQKVVFGLLILRAVFLDMLKHKSWPWRRRR